MLTFVTNLFKILKFLEIIPLYIVTNTKKEKGELNYGYVSNTGKVFEPYRKKK